MIEVQLGSKQVKQDLRNVFNYFRNLNNYIPLGVEPKAFSINKIDSLIPENYKFDYYLPIEYSSQCYYKTETDTDDYKSFSAIIYKLDGKVLDGLLKYKESFYWNSCENETFISLSLVYSPSIKNCHLSIFNNSTQQGIINQMVKSLVNQRVPIINLESIIIYRSFQQIKKFISNISNIVDLYLVNKNKIIKYDENNKEIGVTYYLNNNNEINYSIKSYISTRNKLILRLKKENKEDNDNINYINVIAMKMSKNCCFVCIENQFKFFSDGTFSRYISKVSPRQRNLLKKIKENIEKNNTYQS